MSDLDFLFKANTLIKMCEEKKVSDYERKNINILFIQFVHFYLIYYKCIVLKHFITYKFPYKITSMKSLKITFSHQKKKKDVC